MRWSGYPEFRNAECLPRSGRMDTQAAENVLVAAVAKDEDAVGQAVKPGLRKKMGCKDRFHSKAASWRLSATRQMHEAFGTAYWKEQGLVSLVDRHYELHRSS